MSLRKFQKVEANKVVTPDGHREIESSLHKLGKTSAVNLTEDERKSLDTSRVK